MLYCSHMASIVGIENGPQRLPYQIQWKNIWFWRHSISNHFESLREFCSSYFMRAWIAWQVFERYTFNSGIRAKGYFSGGHSISKNFNVQIYLWYWWGVPAHCTPYSYWGWREVFSNRGHNLTQLLQALIVVL